MLACGKSRQWTDESDEKRDMPIEIVLILLAGACVAAALAVARRGRRANPENAGDDDLRLGDARPCGRQRSRASVRNVAILGIFGLAFVIGVHLVEGRSTRATIQQILEKEFPDKAFTVDGIIFPTSYSAPFLARMDLTPSRVRGSFRLTRPQGRRGCTAEVFVFELQPHSLNFLISIPEPELTKIRLCLST